MRNLLILIATVLLLAVFARWAFAEKSIDWDCMADCQERSGYQYCRQFCSYDE